jgi:hypothetical protein
MLNNKIFIGDAALNSEKIIYHTCISCLKFLILIELYLVNIVSQFLLLKFQFEHFGFNELLIRCV